MSQRGWNGRTVAVCRVAGEDLGAWLVGNGLALAYRRFSTNYVQHEAEARSARRGMWAGEFMKPWRWRRAARLEADYKKELAEEIIEDIKRDRRTGRRRR